MLFKTENTTMVPLDVSGATYSSVRIANSGGSLTTGLFEEKTLFVRMPLSSLPVITLTSPANNQTFARGDIQFQWSGSDPDKDVLTYTFQVGISPGSSNIYNANVGSETSIKGEASNWVVLGTYYWRVIAKDGKGGVTTSDERTFVINNTLPVISVTSPANNLSLSESSSYKLEGTVSDTGVRQALSVKYSIAGGPAQSIPVGTADGVNPKSFSKTLTYSRGQFWDGSTAVSSLLPAEASSIQIWANDGIDDSAKQTRNFSIQQEDGKIYVPVNVASHPYLVSKMAPPVRLSNGWLVVGISDTTGTSVWVYLSKNNGYTWNILTYRSLTTPSNLSLCAIGTKVYLLVTEGSNILFYAVDVQSPISPLSFEHAKIVDGGINSIGSTTCAITPDGTKLYWAASTKNSTFPNSFNIRTGSIPINTDGTLGTPSVVTQVTATNISGTDYKNPSVVIRSDNMPSVAWDFADSTNKLIGFSNFNGTTWTHVNNLYAPGNYAQSSPMAIRTPNGKLYIVWHGTDSSDSINPWIRYSNSTDGTSWLPTPKKLVKGTNASITSDKNGKLTITYEDGGYIKRIESSNEFVSFSGPFVDGVGTNQATFYDQSFATDFSIPPTIYRTSNAVKYRGVLNLNKRPVVTLATPENQTLMENATLKVSGSAVDEDAGNIVSFFFKINNGPSQAAASSISDGSKPILFDKTITYKNKRIYLGNTDLTGVDLTQNTDHILTVWAEDNKQGKSLEVTRKFRVVWNRPPVIDGENKDLGVFMQPPIVNYSATDPEANTFTFTEYLNGKKIRSFAGIADQRYTVDISHDAWIRLDLDVQHQIKIVATDSAGISSERIYTFTRTETHIEFMLEYGNPDIKADFTLDGMPLRVLVTLERYLPEGSSIESVKVCNNYLDDAPTWEDCTGAVKGNRGYLFTNKNKTAPEWAINLWVTIDKGTAKERVLVNGYGGAFD
ncbi:MULTISPECIES: hypothetical protein [unclassified Brevibacillus]|uniref:hypothetical protein n=1 Tax=unclassified Brevibacillus TaxID=2684853 RepID=UPI0035652825